MLWQLVKNVYTLRCEQILLYPRGSEQVLDIFEDMEFPISECDKVVILKKEENEVDC